MTETKTCPGCGEELPRDSSFCPGCGEQWIPATVNVLTPSTRPSDMPATMAAQEVGPPSGTADTISSASSGPTPLERPLAPSATGPAADYKEGAIVAGRFRLGPCIGSGGMGTVYLAEQTAVNRKVVLKFLHPYLFNDQDVIERFHREARAASKLACPNTIVLYDFGQSEAGTLYMAMEYLEGRSLTDVIQSAGAMPALRAIGITLQILSSLDEAHQKGIVHRDLKPDNIMLVNRAGTSDFVKVLDFGIAKLVGERDLTRKEEGEPQLEQPLDRLTQDGAICGSPGYMAPEQVLSEEVDHRADLYAVGVILYEMLAGKRPFRGSNLLELLDFATDGKVESLCASRPELALPRPLDRLLLTCLQKDADARPDSAAELAAALRDLTPEVARQRQDQERALMELVGIRRRWTRHLRWIAPIAAVLLLGLGGWFWFSGRVHVEGTKLGAGERLLVATSAAQVPPWVNAPPRTGARGEAKNRPSRAEALRLARAEVLAELAGVPPRFHRVHEWQRYQGDLQRVLQVVRGDGKSKGPRLVDSIGTFWIKTAVGHKDGVTYRYDGYAYSRPLPAELGKALGKLYAELRYDRHSFLTDEAVRKKDCARAKELAAHVEQAIADMDVKKAKRARLRFFLKLRLKRCLESVETSQEISP